MQLFKNTAAQKLRVFAFADAGHATLDSGEPVTGDAANITAQTAVDNAALGATNDVNPVEVDATNAPGVYEFDPTQAETNGDIIEWYARSSTAGVQVVTLGGASQMLAPPNWPDLGIETDGDLTKVNTLDGHTAQTGDSFARLGAPAGASVSADIATIDTNVDAILVDTGTTIPGTLSTLATATALATVDTNVDAILVDTGTTLPATLATAAALATVDANVDAILVDTAEIGVAGAGLTVLATAAALATVDANVDAILVDTGTTLPASLTTLQTTADNIETDTQNLQTRVPAALVSGRMDSNLAAIGDSTVGVAGFERATSGITQGTVGAGSSDTSITTSSLDPAASVDDQFIGLILKFDKDTATAALRGQATDITDSTAAGVLTVTALTTAPASGDTFTIS